MKKSTFQASSDLALIKYWGKKDPVLRLPENSSLSMILKELKTVTTIEFQNQLERDQILIEGMNDEPEIARVREHLNFIREQYGVRLHARVQSVNSFPKSTGLSSSGSGFAALTCAVASALDLNLSERELSILARYGSGTACRCVCGGFVQWKDGDSSDTSYSETIFRADHMDIRDIVVIISEETKQVSSTQGHKLARSSPFFATRLQHINSKIAAAKDALKYEDFTRLGEIVESEALEFHSVLLTSQPPLIAWYPGTIQVMHQVQQLRREGIEAYFTINTGFNLHVLTTPSFQDKVNARLTNLPLVDRTIVAHVGDKPRETENHLF